MDLLVVATLIVLFGGVIARQLTARGPPVWATFGLGALALLAVGALSPAEALVALAGSAPVLLFLVGLFLFATALDRAGALEHLARYVLGRARRHRDLPALLFVGVGLLSMLVVNDALVLVGVPLVLSVARRMDAGARPLLLCLAFAVTVGSVATPFGNPQNLLVALDSGLPAPSLVFVRWLLLPTLANLALGALYIHVVLGPKFASGSPSAGPGPLPRIPLLPRGGWAGRVRRAPVLLLFPLTIGLIVGSDLASSLLGTGGLPLPWVGLAGGLLTLVLSPGRGRLVRGVDVPILVLFAGLFVVVAAATVGAPFAGSGLAFPVPVPGGGGLSLAEIIGTGLAGPQLVSNVPWVAFQVPLLHAHGFGASTPAAWMALAGASTLAGNLTLLGAASNLIVVGRAEAAGVRIGLAEFVRLGAPLAAMTASVLFAFLLVGL